LRSDPGHILQLLVRSFYPWWKQVLKDEQIPVILDFDIEHPRLSSSSLVSSAEGQRPSRFEFISCGSLIAILRNTLGTDHLQIYHKRRCGCWWQPINGRPLATRSSTFLCCGKHSRWQPLKPNLRTWLSLFLAPSEVSRQLRFFQKHYKVYVFADSNSAPQRSLIRIGDRSLNNWSRFEYFSLFLEQAPASLG